MDHCQNGCPCEDFDCDLALNVTDPVYGLEYLGILETTGWFKNFMIFTMSKSYRFKVERFPAFKLSSGSTYNGECIDMRRPRDNGQINVHERSHYYNDTHIEYCSNFCLNVKSRKTGGFDKTGAENRFDNSTLEVTTGQFKNNLTVISDGKINHRYFDI